MAQSPAPVVDSKWLPKESGPLRYLEAIAPNFQVSSTGASSNATESGKLRYSEDTTLNALAQHGALRLNVKRAMISIVTRSTQYVIAESTRSMSLRNPDVHSPEDGLWMGCCALPTSAGLCQWTVSLANLSSRKTRNIESDQDEECFIVNDFTKDERFKDAPFVTAAPYARFYAGVPIFSQSTGKAIGSYCVIDDKPTESPNSETIDFLKDLASIVADHLELAKIRLEKVRSEKMVRGIGSFIEGKTSIREWWSLKSSQLPSAESDPFTEIEGKMNPKEDEGEEKGERMATRSPTVGVPRQQPRYPQANPNDISSSPKSLGFERAPRENKPENLQPLPDRSLSTEIKRLFSRASNILREATEIEGVLFLDATSTGLRSRNDESRTGASDSPATSGEEISVTENDDSPDMCNVLGFSTSDSSSINSSRAPPTHRTVNGQYMRVLLRRYPTGKIFHIDELSSSDSETASALSDSRRDDIDESSNTQRAPGNEMHAKEKLRISISRRNDAANMAKIFPGARSLAFFPLWDSQKGRWFAGAIAYTNQATRSLTVEGELSYLAAFGNSIMAEVFRIAAVRADRAKTDFISSISHELRSPLHGILGNAEFLKATPMDTLQADMVHSIETCGRTLLDTVNHLLDFAKINNFLRSAGKSDAIQRASKSTGAAGKASAKAGMMMLESNLNLAILTEEVVQTACSGHNFQFRSRANNPDFISSATLTQDAHTIDQLPSMNGISMVLDIQPAQSYIFHAQGGALRRILMNACGNALKYTDCGFVRVKLQSRSLSPSHGAEKSEVTITISDSGRGISKTYLRERLYTPFAQEDPHSPGTGLGLSILKQITTSLRGTIDVVSEVDSGTSLRISLPLKHCTIDRSQVHPRDMQPLLDHDEVLRVAGQTSGWTVAIRGYPEPGTSVSLNSSKISPKDLKASELMNQSLHGLCQSWFGMRVKVDTAPEENTPDIYLTNPAGAEEMKSQFQSNKREFHVIVLCPSSESTAFATGDLSDDENWIFYSVAQPLGPVKFAKILSIVLDRKAKGRETKSTTITTANSDAKTSEKISGGQRHTSPNVTQPRVLQNVPMNLKDDSEPVSDITLLLVDDNAINLQLLVKFCKRENVRFKTATNGLEALEAYKAVNGAFDCVLMDISMPIMDGMEATRELRRFERDTGVKPTTVVALTGLASEGAQQEAFGSGINLFLTKPVRLQELKVFLRTRKDDMATS